MIVSIASGKGGTGKTTVATNLAAALGPEAQLLDCDVEEPNAHLFMRPVLEGGRRVDTMIPEIDEQNCSGCGACAEICRFSAITLVGDKPLTFSELCHGCGGCLEVCPENCILEGAREVGVTEWGVSGTVEFGQGRMRIGETMAPPLIRAVRRLAGKSRVVIIDAPPGTSCPVIAAMHGADYVVLVTEPTPFGLHDLQLAVEATRFLGVDCGLVVNRADLGNREVHRYARRMGIPLLMEIPFERAIAEAYSRGRLLTEDDQAWRDKFTKLYNKIEVMAAC